MIRRENGFARWRCKAIGLAAPFALAAVCPSIAVAGGLTADALSDDVIEMAGALPDRELDGLRGGFAIGPFIVSFGIELRSTIQDAMQVVSLWTINDRIGNQAVGTVVSSVVNLASSTSGSAPPLVTVSNTPGENLLQVQQSGTNLAEITHDGLLTIVRNRFDNVTLDQNVTVNATIANFKGLAQRMGTHGHAIRAATESARFRMNR
jgi:hypothetical protein